jgi:hypothetical protein
MLGSCKLLTLVLGLAALGDVEAFRFRNSTHLERPVRAAGWPAGLLVKQTRPRVGGTSGHAFEMIAPAGHHVKKLTLYRHLGKGNGHVCRNWDDRCIRGVEVEYTNGDQQHAGRLEGDSAFIIIEDKETVINLKFWPDRQDARLGRVLLELSNGKALDWGMSADDVRNKQEANYNIGSGILLGFRGRSDWEIDTMEPIFAVKHKSKVVTDVKFRDYEKHIKLANAELELEDVNAIELRFEGSNYSGSLSGGVQYQEGEDMRVDTSVSFNYNLNFKIGVPLIGELENTFGWTLGTSISKSKNSQKQWKIDYSINPAEINGLNPGTT